MVAKQTLFRLLDEFLELRDGYDGLSRIYVRTSSGAPCGPTTDPLAPGNPPVR